MNLIRNFRNWRAERYAAVVDHAARRGLATVLTGGPTDLERSYATEITALARTKPRDLIGRTSLKQLLAHAGESTGFMSGRADQWLEAGREVGRGWRIVRELDRGGMGVVYLAERADGEYRM